MSISQIILAANWLLEANFLAKWQNLKSNKALLLLLSIFGVHLIGMLYTEDYEYGIHDLRIKLPILILPLLLGTSNSIDRTWWERLLGLFVATCGVISIYGYLGFVFSDEVLNPRELSPFISHIRLSLMMTLSIFFSTILIRRNASNVIRGILLIGIVWSVYFLLQMEALTGLVALLAATVIYSLVALYRSGKKMAGLGVTSALILIPIVTFFYVANVWESNFAKSMNSFEQLEVTTNGNKYQHKPDRLMFENGYPVYLNICWKELKYSWNSVSQIRFDGYDETGQPIKATIIRFLTSKNLTKDQASVESLSEQEIDFIESGIANVRLIEGRDIGYRVYEILWEMHVYLRGNNPGGNSVAQRLEFWSAAWNIITFNNNWAVGVGTGDLKREYADYYERENSKLDAQYRLRAHNQYLTLWVTFGIGGLVWIIFAFVAPFIINGRTGLLGIGFLTMSLISFINEDTLETQAGVSFVLFFTCFLLFVAPPLLEQDN